MQESKRQKLACFAAAPSPLATSQQGICLALSQMLGKAASARQGGLAPSPTPTGAPGAVADKAARAFAVTADNRADPCAASAATPSADGERTEPLRAAAPRRVSAAEALAAQARVLGELRAQRELLERNLETADRQLARTYEIARDELLRRERLQADSLHAMQAWEAAGRPSHLPTPIFCEYSVSCGL